MPVTIQSGTGVAVHRTHRLSPHIQPTAIVDRMSERLEHNHVRVSAVIATLGGESLRSTIQHLNAGSIAPAEILVCIPVSEAHRLTAAIYPNVRVVVTDFKGQVAQRAAGFRQASHDLVVQLDDDVILAPGCLAALVHEMGVYGPRCAISPSLRWLGSDQPVYKEISPPALSKAFYWLLNGRLGCRPGIVTRAGSEIGVYPTSGRPGAVDAEWLPGGCVLHHKTNLIFENYFPFAGKAYCEDLIHSFKLRERGVRLIVSAAALAYLAKPDEAHQSLRQFFNELGADFRARNYYVELTSRSKRRMWLFFVARIIRRVIEWIGFRPSAAAPRDARVRR